jgi:A1 cistron-splicing factor AAR2
VSEVADCLTLLLDRNELLAQMQLAFILVTQLHNFSALEAYKRYISLMCRSSSTLLPESTGLSPSEGLPLVASFLSQVLLPHLERVRQEFFEEDLPDLDVFLLEELSVLRLALRAAQRHYESASDKTSFAQAREAWYNLRQAVDTRFGWKLGGLESDEAASAQKGGKLHYNLLSQPDEEDEYVEEGEDAPVVVEL